MTKQQKKDSAEKEAILASLTAIEVRLKRLCERLAGDEKSTAELQAVERERLRLSEGISYYREALPCRSAARHCRFLQEVPLLISALSDGIGDAFLLYGTVEEALPTRIRTLADLLLDYVHV